MRFGRASTPSPQSTHFTDVKSKSDFIESSGIYVLMVLRKEIK